MKIGIGHYRHMLTPEYFSFACQAGCTDVVVHLTDYFRGETTEVQNDNQPVGGKYKAWGFAGDPHALWTTAKLRSLKRRLEDAELRLAAIENLDPAFWYDILLDGPKRALQIENVKTILRRMGEAEIPILGYNFSLAGVSGRTSINACST